jgi:DNA-binding transcriptional MerR regulator/predicted Zn-dependent protease
MANYLIGALSAATGCKVETIRYYERIELMPAPPRTAGGQRIYTDEHVSRLAFIRHARDLGFNIDTIRKLLKLSDRPDQPCSQVDIIVRRHLDDIDTKIDRLTELRSETQRMIRACKRENFGVQDYRVAGSFLTFLFTMGLAAASAQAQSPAGNNFPPFLAPYYADALNSVGKDLALKEQQSKDDVSRYVYVTPDRLGSLAFENYSCERERCDGLYQNAVQYFNKSTTENAGAFVHATPTEFATQWQSRPLNNNYTFVAKLPNSVLVSAYSGRVDRKVDASVFRREMKASVDRQRYELVRNGDQVQVGLWNEAIHNHARELIQKGQKDDAAGVLKMLVAAAPFNYQAHIDLIDNSTDPAIARASAAVVYDNAEDPQLVDKAARYLNRTNLDVAGLPTLDKGPAGLHVVLVVLPPCDLTVVREAARLYENAIGIPVRISRLSEPWDFGTPSRIADQRAIQQAILNARSPQVDFVGWDRERYKAELLKTVETSDALAKYSTESFVARLDTRPGQYDAGPLVERLAGMLAWHRPRDVRAIYVGLTGEDIFSGDTNYVFSTSVVRTGLTTSILSYRRMTAQFAGDRFESRKRLAERLAKQLVPPTLSALGIPRPTDPTDAYSYADSVARVDQKTLTLSTPTKEALDQLR